MLRRRNTLLYCALFALVVGVLSLPRPADAKPTLVVYTYDSFLYRWGLGPAIKPLFEAQCQCELVYRSFEDAGTLFNTLRIEGRESDADVVVGIDNNMSANAKKFFFAHGIKTSYSLPVPWTDSVFVPFDFGWFAFVYDKRRLSNVPHSFEELLNSDLRLLIQDPRTSSPGLGLLLWVKHVYGRKAKKIWQVLHHKIVASSRSWGESYGLFLKGEADMVLSYTTSPAFHAIRQHNPNYKFALFEEGHFIQIEVAGIAKSTKNIELARKFLLFLTGPQVQRLVPTHNFMYPIQSNAQRIVIPPQFRKALTAVTRVGTLTIAPGRVMQNRKQWIAEWIAAGLEDKGQR